MSFSNNHRFASPTISYQSQNQGYNQIAFSQVSPLGDPEDLLKSKLSTLKQLYETRMVSFEKQIQEICGRIYSDELIPTMLQDQSTQSFVNLRIQEIISDSLREEKETFIERLICQYQELKNEHALASQNYQKMIESLKQQLEQMSGQIEEKDRQV